MPHKRSFTSASQLTDGEIESEFARLAAETAESLPSSQTQTIEYFADVRFRGQSHELKIPVEAMNHSDIARRFHSAYRAAYGRPPSDRVIEVVTLRVRRVGKAPVVTLPTVEPQMPPHAVVRVAELTDSHGNLVRAAVMKAAN
jgi:N-methylhydantoinase A/oxoprolinase/acetone carboxylase beta subunit